MVTKNWLLPKKSKNPMKLPLFTSTLLMENLYQNSNLGNICPSVYLKEHFQVQVRPGYALKDRTGSWLPKKIIFLKI